MNWQKGLRSRVEPDEPLKKYTTLRIGGAARFFIRPRGLSDLKLLFKEVKRYKIPFLVIGAGSNILAADQGVRAAVIKLDAPEFKKFSFRKNSVSAASGAPLARLVSGCQRKGLSGLEFLSGIPGTVGGALAMNAGAWGKQIGDLVEKVSVMDYNGKLKILKKKEIIFGYRRSSLDRFIILGVSLQLAKDDKKAIVSRIRKYQRSRKKTQDLSLPNAGCVFKNPAGDSAGRLLDLCGLKGKSVGRAVVSRKHANFILNKGGARALDVLRLMDLMRKKVKNKFGINLEPEIEIWH